MNWTTKQQKMTKISIEHSCQIRTLYQISNIRGKKLFGMFPQYSKAQIYVHAKKPINGEPVFDKRKLNKGRPRKFSAHDERSMTRTIPKLRKECGSFTSKRLQLESGTSHVSNRTFRRHLNAGGYKYLQSRKKGRMSQKDLKIRLKFCRDIEKKKLTQDFWDTGISFYLDGVGFEFKTRPQDQARAPKAREWRKSCEGLDVDCVAKGKKEGKKNANFMVAISKGKGVVLCKQYFGQITGGKFARIIRTEFDAAFAASSNPVDKVFLQDGCPRQNSACARRAVKRKGATIFSIPSRSPDINCIEIFFHLVSKKLETDTLEQNIEKETFEQFSERVENTLRNFDAVTIDKIIGTMAKRIKEVIKSKGQRIKY